MNDHMHSSVERKPGYAVLLTLVAALGGMLFGYDTAVISGAIGFLQTKFALSPELKGWAASSALAGCIGGALFAGLISDYLGRRNTLLMTAILFLVSAVGTALPRTFEEFIFFRIVGGVGVGAASMISPMYIAEISPPRIRGRLVSLNQLAIVSGMLVVYFVNYSIAGWQTEEWNREMGWRWMFGSEAAPALLFLFCLVWVPESPRWLAKQHRDSEAMAVLLQLGGKDYAGRSLAEIRQNLAQESGSLKQLLAPGMRIVLVIGVILAVLQQVTGINVFLYYAPEIFGQLGAATDSALLQTVAVGAVNLLFTVVAIWTVDLWGRRPLLITAASGMGLCLVAIGLAFYSQSVGTWVLIFMLGYIACFALAMGPVVWVVLAEIFPTKIRGRAMAIATICLWGANFVVSQTFPMLDENPALVERYHHGFSFWIYAVFCAATVVFVLRFVPETKGRSLEEIERMWLHRQAEFDVEN